MKSFRSRVNAKSEIQVAHRGVSAMVQDLAPKRCEQLWRTLRQGWRHALSKRQRQEYGSLMDLGARKRFMAIPGLNIRTPQMHAAGNDVIEVDGDYRGIVVVRIRVVGV